MPVVPELNTNSASVSGAGRIELATPGVIGSSRGSIGIMAGEHRVVPDGVRRAGQRKGVPDLGLASRPG